MHHHFHTPTPAKTALSTLLFQSELAPSFQAPCKKIYCCMSALLDTSMMLQASAKCTRHSASSYHLALNAVLTLLLLATACIGLAPVSHEDQIATVQTTSTFRVETWCLLNTGDASRHHSSRGPKIAPGPLNKGDHAGRVAQRHKMLSCSHQCFLAALCCQPLTLCFSISCQHIWHAVYHIFLCKLPVITFLQYMDTVVA